MAEWELLPNTEINRQKLVKIMNGPNNVRVLRGSVETIFRWLLTEYARRVEPIRPEWCWGYNYRKIEGSNVWSKHAYALAVDLNAPDNPLGVPPEQVMTKVQIDQCHALEQESDGVLRWGGDFGRPDPMHWEIIGTPEQANTLATKIRRAQVTEPANVWAHDIDPTANKYSAGGAMFTLLQRSKTLNTLPTDLAALHATVAAAVASTESDFNALDAALVLINAKLDTLLARHPE